MLESFIRHQLDHRNKVRVPSRRFDAFISYSHALDGQLAPAIRTALHRFARPWYRMRALHVFHDTANLSANPDLWGSIRTALGNSQFFILLASPASANSDWVGREVNFWLRERKPEHMLLVVTDGEIHWNVTTGDFDWDRTTALSAEFFSEKLSAEPLWLDLRPMRHGDQLSPRDPLFQGVVASLASVIRGQSKDVLIGEDVRQWRRVRRLVVSTVLILTLISVTAITLGAVAIQQRDTAVRQKQIAHSRELAARANALRDSRPAVSLMLGVEALRAADTGEAYASLADTLTKSHFTKLLTGHQKPIQQVAFSRDSRLIATASDDETVMLWEIYGSTQRRHISTLRDFKGPLTSVTFSPSSNILATTDFLGSPALWDISDPTRPMRRAQLTNRTGGFWNAVTFSSDGRTLAAAGGDDTDTVLWDVSDPYHPSPLTGLARAPDDVAFSPSGLVLATTYKGSYTILWDIGDRSNPRQLATVPDLAHNVAFSADGLTLATIPKEGPATLWDISTPDQPRRLSILTGVNKSATFQIAFGPAGHLAATANFDGTASLWNLQDRSHPREVAAFRGHSGSAYTVAFAADGSSIATGSADGTAILWNVENRTTVTRLATLSGYDDAPETVTFTPDSQVLLIASNLEGATLWDLSDRNHPLQQNAITTEGLADASFSADGHNLLTIPVNGDATLWDVSDKHKPLRLASFEGLQATLSRDARTVATVKDKTVTLWAVSGPDRPTSLASVPGTTPVFGPGSDLMATTDAESNTILWQISDRSRPVRLGRAIGGRAAFSSDRRTMVTVANDRALLWDVVDPSHPDQLASLSDATGYVTFSPKGNIMAIGSKDGVPQLWDVTKRSQPVRLSNLVGHEGSAYRVAFSPDGLTLATGSYDKSVILWDNSAISEVVGEDPVARACAIAGPGLTPTDWAQYVPDEPYRRTCT